MKAHVEVKKLIPISAESAWGTIRKGDGLEQWLPSITACRLEGDQRFCTLAGGGDVVETIVTIDDMNLTFSYSVDVHPLPIGPVKSDISVRAEGGGCEIVWRSDFEGSDENVKMVVPMLEAMYLQGIDALADHHRQAA